MPLIPLSAEIDKNIKMTNKPHYPEDMLKSC